MVRLQSSRLSAVESAPSPRHGPRPGSGPGPAADGRASPAGWLPGRDPGYAAPARWPGAAEPGLAVDGRPGWGTPDVRRKDRLNRTRRLRHPLVWVAVIALALTAGCERAAEAPSPPAQAPATDSRTVLGAGATFPAPIYEQWFEQFPRTIDGAGTEVRYEAVGSGKGITAFTERKVDFG